MLSFSTRILFILCIVLILVNVISYEIYGTAEEPVLFSTILQRMDEAPLIKLSLNDSIKKFQITKEWNILDDIRIFINYLGQVVGFLVYLVTMLINLLSAIIYFAYLFGLSAFSSFA